jgi:hypothetical protein
MQTDEKSQMGLRERMCTKYIGRCIGMSSSWVPKCFLKVTGIAHRRYPSSRARLPLSRHRIG